MPAVEFIRSAIRLLTVAMLLGAAWSGPGKAANSRHRARTFCVPVFIEGAGTVRLCAPARGR